MKHIFFWATLLVIFQATSATQSFGQNKLAVVDVKQVTDSYFKRQQLVDDINSSAREKSRVLDTRKASYQKMTTDMVKLDRTMNNLSLTETARNKARQDLIKLNAARDAKAAEISAATRKAENELRQQRMNMEEVLSKDVQRVVAAVAKENGYDLAFDKSFLPQSSFKSVLYASPKVADLTNIVIEKLNGR